MRDSFLAVWVTLCLSTAVLAASPEWRAEGWIEGDYSASSARRRNLPLGFNLFANHAHLHQAWLKLERGPLHFDLFAGADHVFTRARGLFAGQHGEIGFDPIQFYMEERVKILGHASDVRVGRFASPIGQEYNAGPSNLLPSHSYSFIYDPFTHTGVYAQTALDRRWTLLNGVVTGSDVYVDPAMRPTYLDGVRYIDAKDGRKSLQLMSILGPARFDVEHGFNHIDVIDLCVTYPLSKRLQLLCHAVYGWEDAVPGLGDVDWLGIVPYLNYTVSDRLAATLRLELFDDDEGNRTGFAGTYRAATLGATWKRGKHLVIRPELRFDHHDGAAPFEGRDHLTTATLNAYLKW